MSSLEPTTKAMYVLYLNMLSSFFRFLISLCLMQANSFAVLYSFARFGQEVASVKKLMTQSKQYDLDRHIAANSQGFVLNLGSFRQVLDKYQETCKGLAREVLHATFLMPRGDADIAKAIAGRIDCLYQMLGLHNDETVCGDQHPVCKECTKLEGRVTLRFPRKACNEGITIVNMNGINLPCSSDKTQLFSAPALSATDFVFIIISAGMIRRWKLWGYRKHPWTTSSRRPQPSAVLHGT